MSVEQFNKTKLKDGTIFVEARVRRFNVNVRRPGGIGYFDTVVTRPAGVVQNANPYPHGQSPSWRLPEDSEPVHVKTLTARGAARRGGRALGKRLANLDLR